MTMICNYFAVTGRLLERAVANGHLSVCQSVCLSHSWPRLYGSIYRYTFRTIR